MSVTGGEGGAPAARASHRDASPASPNLTPPPGNPRFPLFDSMRALAALCVFAGHTVTGTIAFTRHVELFRFAVQLADAGVAIFFALSGFLLYRPFLTVRADGRSVGLVDYARRRLLRIVPAYWMALTLFLALGFVSGVTARNWWIFYGFLQNYRFTTIGTGIGAAWTLCIEVSFYAALPVLAGVAGRLGGSATSRRGDIVLVSVLALVGLAFRARFSSLFALATVSTLPGTFFWFAIGMGLALATITSSVTDRFSALSARRPSWPAFSWGLAVVIFIALYELPHVITAPAASSVISHALYGVTALFLVAPAAFDQDAGGIVRRLLGSRLLVWIGLISYSFYLYHTVVIAQLEKLFRGAGIGLRYPVVALAALAISLAAAAASFYLLERPLMRVGRRRRIAEHS